MHCTASSVCSEIIQDDDFSLSDLHLALFNLHPASSDNKLELLDCHRCLSDVDLGLSDDGLGLFNLHPGLPDDHSRSEDWDDILSEHHPGLSVHEVWRVTAALEVTLSMAFLTSDSENLL